MKVFGRCAVAIVAVLTMLPGAADGEPIHDKADKQEICNWEVDLSADYLQVTLRPFTGDASTAKALFGTTGPDEKVKGLGSAAAFASNASDYTVRAVLGKLALVVQLERSDYDQGNPDDVAELKADATSIATQVAKNL